MLQIAATILDDPSDTTEVSVLYANQTEDDILVREMLDGCIVSVEHHSKYSARDARRVRPPPTLTQTSTATPTRDPTLTPTLTPTTGMRPSTPRASRCGTRSTDLLPGGSSPPALSPTP